MSLRLIEPRRRRVVSEKLLTPADFAKRLHVTRDRVYKWIQRGHLRVHQFGPDGHPTYLISVDEISDEKLRRLVQTGGRRP